MTDSSDEDLNSDNEEIDLKALWRDSPFIREEEHEVKVRPNIDANDSSSRIIILTPIDDESRDSSIQNLVNEYHMNRFLANPPVSTATDSKSIDYINRLQVARQRILNFGRPDNIDEDIRPSSSTQNQTVLWPIPGTSTLPRLSAEDLTLLNEEENIQFRFNQLRHGVIEITQPTWVTGRQTFSSIVPTVIPIKNCSKSDIDKSVKNVCPSNFILPAAIAERERNEREMKRLKQMKKKAYRNKSTPRKGI